MNLPRCGYVAIAFKRVLSHLEAILRDSGGLVSNSDLHG